MTTTLRPVRLEFAYPAEASSASAAEMLTENPRTIVIEFAL